jgi:hypothetical protein
VQATATARGSSTLNNKNPVLSRKAGFSLLQNQARSLSLLEDDGQIHGGSPGKDKPARRHVQPVGGEGVDVRAGEDGRADPRLHIRRAARPSETSLFTLTKWASAQSTGTVLDG